VCTGLWVWLGEIGGQCFFVCKPPETGKYRLESAAGSKIRDSQSRCTEALRTGQCVSLSDSTAQHSAAQHSTAQQTVLFEVDLDDPRKWRDLKLEDHALGFT